MDIGERVASVEATQAQHSKKLDEIHTDVKSLLIARAFDKGSRAAKTWLGNGISGAIGAAAALLTAYWSKP